MEFDKLLDPEVLVFVVGGIVAVVAIVGHAFNVHARTQAERDLKAQMLEQGRPVEEIERVLLAGKELSSKEAVMMNQKHVDRGEGAPTTPAETADGS